MNRLRFELQGPSIESAPNRADIACFIGFVPRRKTRVPAHLAQFLRDRGMVDRGTGARVEAIANEPLSDPVRLSENPDPLRIDIDRQPREIRLPPGDHSPAAIVSLDGVPVGSATDLKAAFDSIQTGSRFAIEFEHEGVKKRFELVK